MEWKRYFKWPYIIIGPLKKKGKERKENKEQIIILKSQKCIVSNCLQSLYKKAIIAKTARAEQAANIFCKQQWTLWQKPIFSTLKLDNLNVSFYEQVFIVIQDDKSLYYYFWRKISMIMSWKFQVILNPKICIWPFKLPYNTKYSLQEMFWSLFKIYPPLKREKNDKIKNISS